MISEYWDATNSVYKNLNDQFDILAGDLKHIKTLKTSLILEYVVVIMVTLFSHDAKTSKATQQQFKNLNYYIHQNILILIDIIIEKLPPKESAKDWMTNLKAIIDNKLNQMNVQTSGISNKNHSKLDIVKQNCEVIIPLIKTIIGKKPLHPKKGKKSLAQVVIQVVKSLDSYTYTKAREVLHKASTSHTKKPKMGKKANQLPPLYMIGGTALGGLAPLPKVKSPYLPENKTGKKYTLVLDLDETLVHYYEINGKGKYNIRPS